MEIEEMTQLRLPRSRTVFCACVLVLAGLTGAAAQQGASPFPPPPGQQAAQPSSVFPPPPGQTGAASPFPPAPGQSSAFPSPNQVRTPSAGSFTSAPQGGRGFSPAPQGGGFGAPSGGGGGPSEAQKICLTFPSIREEVEKGAATIKAASDRKATREEVCPLFKSFALKESKLVKFLVTNQKLCGVPPNVITQVKANHSGTIKIRNQVCSNAPAGPPPGPSLSDALGGPIIADDPTVNKGRGTFDTLTGNVLSR